MLAATQGELDSLKLICSRARYLGMETEIITVEEAQKFNPLIDEQHFIGALWRADGGHCDPSGTTHAYAKAARTARRIGGALHAGAVAGAARRWHVGRGDRQRHASTPSTSSTAAGSGRARSGTWPASSCRCSPWSIIT